jgi:hypothetical protein
MPMTALCCLLSGCESAHGIAAGKLVASSTPGLPEGFICISNIHVGLGSEDQPAPRGRSAPGAQWQAPRWRLCSSSKWRRGRPAV